MKTAIYYFSGTGNTLVIARDLAKSLGDAELIPIVKALKDGAVSQHDVIGIVFPVYVFGLPIIVAEFVRKLKAPKDAYIFTVANCGGLPGRSITMMKDILAKNGSTLAAAFGLLMPGNYIPLYGAKPEEEQRKMFEAEKARIPEIARAVAGRRSGLMKEEPFLLNLLIYLVCYRIGMMMMHREDKYFLVTDKCTRCGLCARVCPVSNIEMRDGRPAWLHHCEQCMACLQWCPVEAIQFGKKTAGRKRYRHPEVRADDIAAQRK